MSFKEQVMSKDKYLSILVLSRWVEAIVSIFLQIFFVTCMIFTLRYSPVLAGEYSFS